MSNAEMQNLVATEVEAAAARLRILGWLGAIAAAVVMWAILTER